MILLVDNYDSFVHNLARYFQRLGQETVVVRNDRVTPDDVVRLAPDALVLSPGPCTPAEAGSSVDLVHRFQADLPILGVCLGHQAIAAALGGRITRAPEPMHGRTSSVQHDGSGLFQGLPSPLTVCRYHSLVVDEASLPTSLRITARAEDGCIMAMEHVNWPVFGVQFHPEATLTSHGYELLASFLGFAGLPAPTDAAALATSESPTQLRDQHPLPIQPVTF